MYAEIPDSQNLHSTVSEKVPNNTVLKEELISLRQLKTAFVIQLALSTTGIYLRQITRKFKTT